MVVYVWCCFFFFQAEDGIRVLVRSRGLGDVYKRQLLCTPIRAIGRRHAVCLGGCLFHVLSRQGRDHGKERVFPSRERQGFGQAVAVFADIGRHRMTDQLAVARADRFLALPVVALGAVSYTHLRAHETVLDLVCRLLL